LLNMRMGIFVPFTIMFLLFILDILSSTLQIFWKKRFKKKLFTVSPFHHLLENKWHHETTIVMKAWMLQALLAIIAIIMIFYQMSGTIVD
jgi:phospho-N-acetylmuramoyl-pentapeptide-transferase